MYILQNIFKRYAWNLLCLYMCICLRTQRKFVIEYIYFHYNIKLSYFNYI